MMPMIRDAVIYANLITLLSIGFTLTYLTSKIPNFTHGTFAGIGIYVTFSIVKLLKLNPYISVFLSFILCATIATLVYVVVLSFLRRHGATRLSLMISTLAVELIMLACINIYADYIQRKHAIVTRIFLLRHVDFKVFRFPGVFIVSTIIAILSIIILHLLLTKTKFGIAMRATVENADLAEIFGINTELVCLVSWFLTGGLAGLAGSLLPLWFQSDPFTGSRILLTVFAASVLGGLSSIYGAIIGGYIIGLSEVIGNYYLSLILGSWIAAYRLLIPLSILCVILLLMPNGIAGAIEILMKKIRRIKHD